MNIAPFHRPVLHALARSWRLVLLRGIAGIMFGILALAWPSITLFMLVAYATVDGITGFAAAFTDGGKPPPTWWLVVVGFLGVAAGSCNLVWPGITALVLILFIGAWAVAHGIFEIIGAIQLRHEIDNEWMLILAGVLSVAFGIVVLLAPGAGAVGLAMRLRTHRHAAA